ncbi:MAG: spermidine synthase [Candidatus Limnocylindria bacterium]
MRTPSAAAAIVFTSAAVLLAELILIRWIPAKVVYVGFFNNLILIASFLGIGLGVLLGRRFGSYAPYGPVLLLILIVAMNQAQVDVGVAGTDLFLGYSGDAVLEPSLLVVGILVALSTLTMALLALPLGPLLRTLPPLRAYSLDIAGALVGIALFAGLSFLSTPPFWWLVVLGLLLAAAALSRGPVRRDALGGLAMLCVIGLGAADLQLGDRYSPYYRITAHEHPDGTGSIAVNGIGHQSLARLGPEQLFYDQVYDWLPERRFEHALIIGAGAGNDVAVALAHGVDRVDAVEIDPVIQAIGVERHPERPYDDARVRRIVADGRAHLRTTDATYDLIVFALTDSLTLVTNTANLRLESFLFTREAFADARDRLRPNGVMVLYNHYRETWLISRYVAMAEDVFGHPAMVRTYADVGASAAVIAVGRDGLPAGLAEPWSTADAPAPATDDWPFPYLRTPGIAPSYLLVLLSVLAFAAVTILGATRAVKTTPTDAHFFLLGAAFLLLETKSLATFGLLFGTTWYVNALVFGAILTSVFLAVAVSARVRVRDARPLFAALLAALGLAYVLDPTSLLFEPAWLRYAVASALAFAPIFLANLIFARSFRDTENADIAFGWNLLGAVFGGVLEYAALAVGYRQLLVIVALLYLGAALVVERRQTRPVTLTSLRAGTP